MKRKTIVQIKIFLASAQHKELAIDVVLIAISLVVPYASIPVTIIGVIRIIFNFRKLREEREHLRKRILESDE